MALGLSQNTREIVNMRQRLFASQEADARAASRNASLLRDLEASLGTLKRQAHVRMADEARAAHAEAGSKQLRLREAQAREVAALRAELAEIHERRRQAAAQFQEELELREAISQSKQQLRVELELERFDDATREALRTGVKAEVTAAEGSVEVCPGAALPACLLSPDAHGPTPDRPPTCAAEQDGHSGRQGRAADARRRAGSGGLADPMDRG